MNRRALRRALWLGLEIARSALEALFSSRPPNEILHRASRRAGRIFGLRIEVAGPVPRAGLLVCNHLGYLDVIAIAALAPARFVAKSEVRSWPVFGWFARRFGTIFVERGRPAQAPPVAGAIARALRAGELVVLFPEGTSSGGKSVLPFKSALLQAGVGGPVYPARLDFSLEPGDGDPSEEICYWKDMSFAPHLWRLLGKRTVRARLTFGPPLEPATDRKILARRLHAAVAEGRKT